MKRTVKDLEDKTGKPDSIRNLDGRNARSDKHLATLEKQAASLATKLVLPDDMPLSITINYPDGRTKSIAGDGMKAGVAYMQAIGAI